MQSLKCEFTFDFRYMRHLLNLYNVIVHLTLKLNLLELNNRLNGTVQNNTTLTSVPSISYDNMAEVPKGASEITNNIILLYRTLNQYCGTASQLR